MNPTPFVSVIIPCYQEKRFIAECLDSLLENDYPQEKMEILVLDGGSTDGTGDILGQYSSRHPFIKVLENREKFQAFAMNKGIKESRGEIIIRCDAHSSYSRNYISRSVSRLSEDASVGNVGGIWVNSPSGKTRVSLAIAHSLECPLCVGPNSYRTGARKACFVNTVPFGAWRREVFEEVGFFDENLRIAEDFEFNLRLIKSGRKILLDPEIQSRYRPRESFGELFKMMFRYGYWKNFVNRKHRTVSSFRQILPPLFVLYLFALVPLIFASPFFALPLALYFALVVIYGFRIGAGKKSLNLVPFCALTFLLSHTGYGAGFLKGFWDVFIRRKRIAPGAEGAAGTGGGDA